MNAERVEFELAVNASCERVMRAFLVAQLAELDRLGMGHIPYAVKVQRCLDGDVSTASPLARSPRAEGPARLRLVE